MSSCWLSRSGLCPSTFNLESQYLSPCFTQSPSLRISRDAWDIEESIKFYRGTLEVDTELGVSGRVFHETHRNRSMFTPYAAQQILKAVPQYEPALINLMKIKFDLSYYRLRITADFSHWMVGLERLLDVGEGDRAMMDSIIPHVSMNIIMKWTGAHFHSRYTTFTPELERPRLLNALSLWIPYLSRRDCALRGYGQRSSSVGLKRMQIRRSSLFRNTGGLAEIILNWIWLTYLSPFPYHPIGSAKSHGQVADEEGKRLQVTFTQFAAKLTGV